MAHLDVADVTVRFGGHLALDGVSLVAPSGRVTGLIGPNGAGKTTLFNVITGLLEPDAGRIAVDGRDITRLPPYKRARRGLARTFQRLELWGQLTVRENVAVAADVGRRGGRRSTAAAVDEIVARVGLRAVAQTRSDSLPTGQARLVEIARALASDPEVLLLDEPASGLDERETAELALLLRALGDEGLAVVLVEHDVALVMQVCDEINVLDFGRVIASGPPEAIRADDAVIAAYLGSAPT